LSPINITVIMEKYLDLTREQFSAFAKLPDDGPFQMLNLLKFKKQVEETGLTGKEQYKVYMKAATPFLQNSNAKVLLYTEPQFTLIGPTDHLEWDKVLIVEYGKKSDFMDMITTEGYPAHLRKLAMEDSRLIFCSTKS